MEIETLPTELLIPYEFNNVKHPESQVNRLANSIKEFGFNVPIVINADNIVIAGHGRLMAAKKLGLEEVPVVRKEDLTPAQEKAYRILDNKLTRDSEWDFENLQLEIEVLKDANFDILEWGLDAFLPAPVVPKEYTEEVAEGVVLEAKFKVTLPVDDSDSFEERLDELLREFPSAKKEKSI
ncbi:MAG: hypothetical protein E6R03_09275 [Hyphomicrobiaceae bacterium]|nr:MAG: hypothetical protein E6R03_09275 [Hyphomicrobiaceae bacterium]